MGDIALQLDIPLTAESVMSPEEVAAILDDEPVNSDPAFDVRKRIRDGRLASYRRADVEAWRKFEAGVKRRYEKG